MGWKYWLFTGAAVAAEMILTSVMLFSKLNGVAAKCLCSAAFVLTGLLAAISSGRFGIYAALTLLGLAASFLGDLLLQLSGKKYFLPGMLAFLAAHCLYIAAFGTAAAFFSGDGRFFPLRRILWTAAVATLLALLMLLSRMRFGNLLIPVLIYTAAISLMFVMAVSLGMASLRALPAPAGTALMLSLAAGALLFLFSDTVLAFGVFGGKSGKGAAALNLYTYYAAQALIASSIWLVQPAIGV